MPRHEEPAVVLHRRQTPQSQTSEHLWHALRTGSAAAAAYGLAEWIGIPESYWAAISAIIVMQSSLGAAWSTSKQRLLGTLLGGGLGACLVSVVDLPHVVLYGVVLVLLGWFCVLLRMELVGYRFAGVTFTIVVLVADPQQVWWVGTYRFLEVSLGIVSSLVVTAVSSRIARVCAG
ncbi:MAG: FUSC family protein [Synechococcus sp.]